MSNWEKAQYIVAALNQKGAELGSASWAIVSKALDDLDANQQCVQWTADDDPQPGSLDYWAAVTSKNSKDDRRR